MQLADEIRDGVMRVLADFVSRGGQIIPPPGETAAPLAAAMSGHLIKAAVPAIEAATSGAERLGKALKAQASAEKAAAEKRSKAALKAHETRRAQAKAEKEAAEKRSKAAFKAHETRRARGWVHPGRSSNDTRPGH